MHEWGDLDSQGNDICYQVGKAADYIGNWLRKWARMSVMQSKEKFGTVRIYCYFGWENLGSITHPGYYFIPKKVYKWPWIRFLNPVIIPIQKYLYRLRYKMAIKKWPHLREEILCAADYYELLKGL